MPKYFEIRINFVFLKKASILQHEKTMKKRYVIALLTLCLAGSAYSQTLEQARNWFSKGEFAKAKPVFKKLVKQSPSNTNYNFWYGACCYETGDLKEALPYLKKSAERKVINAYLYLGRYYYDIYRFDDAISNLEENISWLEKKKLDTSKSEALLERTRMAARMLRGTENVAVIDSFVVDKADFLSAYKLSKETGSFTANEDGTTTEYVNELEDKKFLAIKHPEKGYRLYSQIKMIDKWSDIDMLKGLSDGGTRKNLNYPFMSSDGITLYYAAQGDESLGGYDIFVTRFNPGTGKFLVPDNIGMPFNSPSNDYLYVIDEYNNLGWFASDRYQPEDKVCVYVFAPNESKEVYDYENTPSKQIIAAASLRSIKSTWNKSNADKLRIARQQLAQIMYGQDKQKKRSDFRFVVNDNAIYHSVKDFKSDKARDMFKELQQLEKDLFELEESLDEMRTDYKKANKAEKESMAPAILDKEDRVKGLREEIGMLTNDIRTVEIKTIQ